MSLPVPASEKPKDIADLRQLCKILENVDKRLAIEMGNTVKLQTKRARKQNVTRLKRCNWNILDRA